VDGKVSSTLQVLHESYYESEKGNSDSHDGDCDQDISPSEDD